MLASPRLTRLLIAVTYLVVIAAGASVLYHPPKSYAGLGELLTTTWGVLCLGPALVSLAGVILRLHVLEWAPLYLLAAGLTIYAALSWWQVPESLGSMPRAWLIVGGVTATLARATWLATQDLEARRAVLARAEVTNG